MLHTLAEQVDTMPSLLGSFMDDNALPRCITPTETQLINRLGEMTIGRAGESSPVSESSLYESSPTLRNRRTGSFTGEGFTPSLYGSAKKSTGRHDSTGSPTAEHRHVLQPVEPDADEQRRARLNRVLRLNFLYTGSSDEAGPSQASHRAALWPVSQPDRPSPRVTKEQVDTSVTDKENVQTNAYGGIHRPGKDTAVHFDVALNSLGRNDALRGLPVTDQQTRPSYHEYLESRINDLNVVNCLTALQPYSVGDLSLSGEALQSPLSGSSVSDPTFDSTLATHSLTQQSLPQNHQHDQPRCFRPMKAVLDPQLQETLNLMTPGIGKLSDNRFSRRYCGQRSDANASQDHVPDSENCALWLTNLPADVTYHELLSSIRNVGRVYCTVINYPDNETGASASSAAANTDSRRHTLASAKIVFFQPEAGRILLHKTGSSSPDPIIIRGQKISARPNRIKRARQTSVGDDSRVLIITGHAAVVNEIWLTSYFSRRFVFQIDYVRELQRVEDYAVIEFAFGSYRCQSKMGKLALETDCPFGVERVEYGRDPCEYAFGNEAELFGIVAN